MIVKLEGLIAKISWTRSHIKTDRKHLSIYIYGLRLFQLKPKRLSNSVRATVTKTEHITFLLLFGIPMWFHVYNFIPVCVCMCMCRKQKKRSKLMSSCNLMISPKGWRFKLDPIGWLQMTSVFSVVFIRVSFWWRHQFRHHFCFSRALLLAYFLTRKVSSELRRGREKKN